MAAGEGPALWTVHNLVIIWQSWTGTGVNIIKYYHHLNNYLFNQLLIKLSSLSHVFPCGFLEVLKVIIDKRLLINCQNKHHNILNKRCEQK